MPFVTEVPLTSVVEFQFVIFGVIVNGFDATEPVPVVVWIAVVAVTVTVHGDVPAVVRAALVVEALTTVPVKAVPPVP